MKRVMVNFDDEMGRQVAARAKAENRSMSAHIVRLVEQDLAAAGISPNAAELAAAAEEVGGPDKAIAILQGAKRSPRKHQKLARKFREAA